MITTLKLEVEERRNKRRRIMSARVVVDDDAAIETVQDAAVELGDRLMGLIEDLAEERWEDAWVSVQANGVYLFDGSPAEYLDTIKVVYV